MGLLKRDSLWCDSDSGSGQGCSVDSLRHVARSPTDLDHPIRTADLLQGSHNECGDDVSVTILCSASSSVRKIDKAQEKVNLKESWT